MDSIVQFTRNLLCCIKDLHWFPDSSIHDSAVTETFLTLPEPFNKTSPLEILIGITQFYAFATVSYSGLTLIFGQGLSKLRKVETLKEKRTTGKKSEVADRLVDERLEREAAEARKNIFIGINVFSIGVCFFWLFANSFHVTETPLIGGLQALINALTVMEIALLPLLYFMLADSVNLIGKAATMEYLAKILRKCTDKVPSVIITDETFSILLQKGWTPFWSGKTSLDDEPEEKKLSKEVTNLVSQLDSWCGDKDQKAMKVTIQETATRLEADAVTTRYEGYIQFLYFILNFVAFYGYLLGVVVYYHGAEDTQPVYIRGLKLGMNNSDADWSGNFAGDLMWTVEPVVIMGSPMLMKWLKPKTRKIKQD